MSSYLALADGAPPAPPSSREPPAAPAPGTSKILYRHALESVFSFLSIRELNRALQVRREWLAAVTSMRPLLLPMACSITTRGLFGSRLARHISHWRGYPAQSEGVVLLSQLTAALVNLRELEWTISMPFEANDPPVLLPTKLRTLTFHIKKRQDESRSHDRKRIPPPTLPLPPDISAMHDLTTLTISCPREYAELLRLSDYAKAIQLRALHLVIGQDHFMRWVPTQGQIDVLRSMSHLHKLTFPGSDMKQYLRLLDPSHSLSLRFLCWDDWRGDMDKVDEAIGAKVATLAHSLQSFKFTLNASSAAFLRPLVNLTDLSIAAGQFPECAETLVDSLRDCARLKSLSLAQANDLQSHHLAAILATKPDLTRLTLFNLRSLNSLAWLADCPARASLADLRIQSCTELPLDELPRLSVLSSLVHLDLSYSFTAEREKALLEISVRLLCPTLKTLTYVPPKCRRDL